MSKNSISIIIFIIILIIFINAFSASYTSRNISNLAYIFALGIDKGENAKIKISAQLSKIATSTGGGGSSGEGNNPILISCEANSIFSGINLLNTYIGKELNLAHCSVFVFSKEFAQDGISSEIYSLINNEEVRPSTNLVLSTCDAYDYLKNSNPNLERLTTKYYETFSITDRFTGYISNITIGNFYNTLASKDEEATAILGGLNSAARSENSKSSSNSNKSDSSDTEKLSSESSGSSNSSNNSSNESSNQSSQEQESSIINPEDLTAGTSSASGKRGTENIGLAVFENDKFRGELTATETICHLLINNDLDSCIISIGNPIVESEKMELQLFPSKKTKITINIIDGIPHISIKLYLNADVMTLEQDIDYEIPETLEKISSTAKDYLKNEFDKYLNKVSKEYNCDIDEFYTKAIGHFATIPEWENFNWKEKFKNAVFNVDLDFNVTSSLLVTKT